MFVLNIGDTVMTNKVIIPTEDIGKYGVSVHAKTMLDTNENRFALRCKDGTSVTITQAPLRTGYWQEAHSHSATRELYFVWKGVLVYVYSKKETIIPHGYKAGKWFFCEPKTPHSVFVSAGTVFGTTKFQLPGFEFPDYRPELHLDARIKALHPDAFKGLLCDVIT